MSNRAIFTCICSKIFLGSSLKLLLIPAFLYLACATVLSQDENPFAPFLFISHHIPSPSDDPRYSKGWLDLVFIGYYVIVFSFVREFTLHRIVYPIARALGLRKHAKVKRFGEQGYAMLYWGSMGIWGAVRAITHKVAAFQ